MKSLTIDLETRCNAPIKDCGSFRYIDDPSFAVMLFGYSVDEAPSVVIDLTAGEEIPQVIVDAVYDPSVLKVAHNCAFERYALWKHFGRYCSPEEWFDTAHLTAHCGLPLGLDAACEALGLPQDKAKMKVGKTLIRQFCSPQKRRLKKWNMAEWITPEMDPENWQLFKDYCARDVDTENYIWSVLRRWMPDETERRIWCLDARINEEGIKADLVLASQALEMDAKYKAELSDKAVALTGLDNPNSVSQIKEWLESQEDIDVPTLNKKAVADIVPQLKNDVSKQFMAIRAELSKTSTKKYTAFQRCAGPDERIRGCFQFFGGHTGRWCLTGDHEVLTPTGWIRLDEWTGGRIAVWSAQHELLSFQSSNALVFDYEGDMIAIDSQRCQQISTPDHAMPVLNRAGCWESRTMESLYGRRFSMPFTGYRTRDGYPRNDNELRVLIMVQADGHFTDSGDLKLGFKRPRKVARCKTLLRRAGITYQYRVHGDGRHQFTVKTQHQPIWLRQFRDKTFDWWVLDEDPRVIIEELELWDGTRCGPNSIQYTSTVRKNVEVIQAICQLTGLSSTQIVKSRDAEHPNWSDAYILNIWLTPGHHTEIRPKQQSKIAFCGRVYCAETPTGYFMVRRNGAVWVTGNSGRNVQLQNLPQNHLPDLDDARAVVRDGDYEFLKLAYGNVSGTLSELIRTTLIPEEGHQFIVADFSAIEARVSAWFAGEEWRLNVFREGGDIYCQSASQMFKVPVVKNGINGELRQKGKVAELACGYGGGVNALIAFGADKMGMSNEEMVQTVDQWRAASPRICEIWRSLEKAMRRCIVQRKTTRDTVAGVQFRWDSNIVWMRLPSGREMAYYQPEYGESRFTKGKMTISYMGTNQKTRKWERIEVWGGRIFENLVQATSRDALRDSMLRLYDAGWNIRGHVHDEVICSEPIDGRSVKDMADIMSEELPWAPGLPLRADGYSCSSYRKD